MLPVDVLEASPSLVYGAALLMRLGASTPSRVQIPEPPLLSHGPGQLNDRGFGIPGGVRSTLFADSETRAIRSIQPARAPRILDFG